MARLQPGALNRVGSMRVPLCLFVQVSVKQRLSLADTLTTCHTHAENKMHASNGITIAEYNPWCLYLIGLRVFFFLAFSLNDFGVNLL